MYNINPLLRILCVYMTDKNLYQFDPKENFKKENLERKIKIKVKKGQERGKEKFVKIRIIEKSMKEKKERKRRKKMKEKE